MKKKKYLADTHPKIAREFHPTKNGDLVVDNLTYGSSKKIYWQCINNHVWQQKVYIRTKNKRGCVDCYKQKLLDDNSLVKKFPNIAREWHPTKNKKYNLLKMKTNSRYRVWWICSKNHEWQMCIHVRVGGSNCPECNNIKTTKLEIIINAKNNYLANKCPQLIEEWDNLKNGNLTPYNVTFKSHKKIWWKCSKGHEYCMMVFDRLRRSMCPYCEGKRVTKETSLASKNPDLIKEWNFKKNTEITPDNIFPGSDKKVWWICINKHEWEAN